MRREVWMVAGAHKITFMLVNISWRERERERENRRARGWVGVFITFARSENFL